jgi:hypothetical protein
VGTVVSADGGDRLGMAIRAESEGKRALAEQVQSLQELRTRATWTVSAGGVVGTLALAHVSNDDLRGAGKLALTIGIGGLVLCALSAVVAQWPKDFELSFDASALVRDYVDVPGQSELNMTRDLALFLQLQHLANGKRLRSVRWAAATGLVGLGLEVVGLAWAIYLAPK